MLTTGLEPVSQKEQILSLSCIPFPPSERIHIGIVIIYYNLLCNYDANAVNACLRVFDDTPEAS
jgi:hypothetical protein